MGQRVILNHRLSSLRPRNAASTLFSTTT